ncbi:MAG: DegT/DnrJ/EryC1/StrS family aminotransferase [Gammaproteobacteria bacterium]|nr:DegT/DnrJ/EryC1/StrS family aminotransferase [Gammaproteobacteria bacterium]
MQKNIQMLDLPSEYQALKPEIDSAIARCLQDQHWILGPEVKALEEACAHYLGTKNSLGVSSGTSALVISLRALAIAKKGKDFFDSEDKIITTPFTFTATGGAILQSGATPLFVDIDPTTFNLDPSLVEQALQTVPSVVGIVAVHLYGQSCEMDKLLTLSRKHNIFCVEDTAQAFGGAWQGKKLGTLGEAGAFSFFPSKNLGGFGDGGLIATGDAELAELARMLRQHGGKEKTNADYLGDNARLDTFQAAILLVKLKVVDEWNRKRQKIAERYTHAFREMPGLIPPQAQKNDSVFHQYTLRVMDGRRDALQAYLKEQGIHSVVYYPVPLHRMRLFQRMGTCFGKLECSEQMSTEVLSLPIEPLLSEEDTLRIVKEVQNFLN